MIEDFIKPFFKKYVINSKGGYIYVDRKVYRWLQSFSSNEVYHKSIVEEEIYKQISKDDFNGISNAVPPKNLPKISIILVLFNSEYWVDNLKQMFSSLKPWIYEIIVVDNGSSDNCLNYLNDYLPSIKCIKNQKAKSYAAAINQGAKIAKGDVFLLINPDVIIPISSLWALVDCYNKNYLNLAGISPKLMLMKTPGFINGVGNIVKPFSHGYDQGLGSLDVGQFDETYDLPSACYATILIPKKSWEEVGELDEEFPLYYEDTDWCYRARLMNKNIIFCPHAKVYHAYKASSKNNNSSKNEEIMKVTLGRIRFTKKNIERNFLVFYLVSFFLNDIINYFKYLFLLKKSYFTSLFSPWISEVFNSKIFKSEKKANFHKFFSPQLRVGGNPSIYQGFPVLTYKKLIWLINYRNNYRNHH